MVLVFTSNANNSNEIRKELALASQNNLVVIPVRVIPVRIEDVTPNEAFAYEFATQHWIDLFGDWENSITRLVELIAASIDDPSLTGDAAAPSFGKTVPTSLIRRPGPRWAMISGLAVVVAAGIAYEVATSPQQPAPVSATVTKGAPTQSEAPALVGPSGPNQPAALVPPQPLPPVRVASSVPSEPVAQPQQNQPPAPSTAPTPEQSAPTPEQSGAPVPTASGPPAVSNTMPAVVQPSPNEAERAWALIKDTTSVAVLQTFVRSYGNTIYGQMARARLNELKSMASKPRDQSSVANLSTIAPPDANTAPTKTIAPKVSPANAPTGPCGPIIGTWLWYNGVTVKVNSNNTTTQSNGDSATVVCAEGVYSFTWLGFATTRMTLSSDGTRLSGTSLIGPTSAVRQ